MSNEHLEGHLLRLQDSLQLPLSFQSLPSHPLPSFAGPFPCWPSSAAMSGFYLFDDSRGESRSFSVTSKVTDALPLSRLSPVTFEGQEIVPLPDGSDWGSPELRTICLQLDAFLTATENLPENTTLSSESEHAFLKDRSTPLPPRLDLTRRFPPLAAPAPKPSELQLLNISAYIH